MVDTANDTFLVTTPLNEFCNIEAKSILFLGEWCYPYEKKEIFSKPKYITMESPWEKKELRNKAREYVNQLYQSMLVCFADMMNKHHRLSYDVEFWRIIVGYWLNSYIAVLYDRYFRIKQAFDKYPSIETITLDLENTTYTCQNIFEFADRSIFDDAYNFQIFSKIISVLYPKSIICSKSYKKLKYKKISFKLRPRPIVGKILFRVQKSMCRKSEILLKRVYFHSYAQIKIHAYSLGRFGFDNTITKLNGFKKNKFLRDSLIFDYNDTNEFERIIKRLIIDDIPLIFIEGFRILEKETRKQYPRCHRTIISSISWYYDEPFLLHSALCKRSGSKLVSIQHGGGYIPQKSPYTFEYQIVDDFYSWGWETQEGKAVIKKAPVYRFANKPRQKNNHFKKILYIGTAPFRYTFSFGTAGATDILDAYKNQYYDDQKSFISILSYEIKENLVFRSYGNGADTIDNSVAAYKKVFPELKVEDRAKSKKFEWSLAETRLCVTDYISSSVICEILYNNIPLILFWRREYEDFTEESEQIYKMLKEVQILHNSYESAANLINDICNNIEEWWFEPQRQKVVDIFRDKFAYKVENPFKWWMDELKLL